jgi:capsular polysaccharide biosynthesis protein
MKAATSPQPNYPDRPRLLGSILLGLLLTALIAAAGVYYSLAREVPYTAKASVVVLPAQGLEPATAAGYYETLSRGQIVATLAEVLRLQRFEQSAALRLRLTAAQKAQTKVAVEVVPTTAMINISVSGTTARGTEAMADVILADAVPYLSQLSAPYTVSVVGSAANSAVHSGPSTVILLAATVLIGLISGIAAQQGAYHLSVASRRRRFIERTISTAPPEESQAEDGHVIEHLVGARAYNGDRPESRSGALRSAARTDREGTASDGAPVR